MKTFLKILCMSFVLQSAAQQTSPNTQTKQDRVEALRVAYITQHLNLTADEAQRFWPVYNGYRGDLKTLRHNFKIDNQDGTPLNADQQLEFEQKKLDLKKRYKPQFEQCIGKEKLNLLLNAEEGFKRELVRTLRERRDGQGPNPGRGRRF